MMKYLITLGDALSQLGNALLFNSGNANESISGRAYRKRAHWFWKRVYRSVNWVFRVLADQDNHCAEAHFKDLDRAEELLRAFRPLP